MICESHQMLGNRPKVGLFNVAAGVTSDTIISRKKKAPNKPQPEKSNDFLQLLPWWFWMLANGTINGIHPFYLHFWYFWEHMSHFSYSHKMRCPLNLVLENWEYLWFYWTFWIVILDGGLKLHKLLIHTLVIFRKDEKYIKSLFEVPIVLHFLPYLLWKNLRKKFQYGH